MQKYPLISYVIPTKDRPEMVDYTLYSLSKQTNDNFEVILSDNYDMDSCKYIFDKYNNRNFKYYNPGSNLSMCDHWEFAISKANGSYISLISDKYMVYSFATEQMANIINLHSPDIISCSIDRTFPIEDISKIGFYGFDKKRNPEFYDAKDELKRIRNDVWGNFDDGYSGWFRGKICYGVYKKELVMKIIKRYGHIFPPFSPDYTSLCLGLSLANKCYDFCKPLMMLCSIKGNGATFVENYDYSLKVLESNYPNYNPKLFPIPNLDSSAANLVAFDMYVNCNRTEKFNYKDIDPKILSDHSLTELNIKAASMSKNQYDAQLKYLINYARKHDVDLEFENREDLNIHKKNPIKSKLLRIYNSIGFFKKFWRLTSKFFSIKITGDRYFIYDLLDEFHLKDSNTIQNWRLFKFKKLIKMNIYGK